MIEGDLMSMTLRTMLQERFGGRGVGFVPITSITNFFRLPLNIDFQKDGKVIMLTNQIIFFLLVFQEKFLCQI